jgi:hypothetical protein
MADAVKGEVPVGVVVLKSGVTMSHNVIVSQLVHMVRLSGCVLFDGILLNMRRFEIASVLWQQ